MEKELKIEVPQGYEIDKEKSTFEKIVFKKVEDSLAKLPKTWEEYCKHTKNRTYYTYICCCESHVGETAAHGFYGEFSTQERAKQYITLGKLLQLRDYWIGDWKGNSSRLANTYTIYNNDARNTVVAKMYVENFPLTFPTKEMAEKFKECFEDLIKEAYPLV